jgi:hypothetical protein
VSRERREFEAVNRINGAVKGYKKLLNGVEKVSNKLQRGECGKAVTTRRKVRFCKN